MDRNKNASELSTVTNTSGNQRDQVIAASPENLTTSMLRVRGGKERKGKERKGKERKGKEREGKGREGKGREGKGRKRKRKERTRGGKATDLMCPIPSAAPPSVAEGRQVGLPGPLPR